MKSRDRPKGGSIDQAHSRSSQGLVAERAEDSTETTREVEPSRASLSERSKRRALVVEADPVTLRLCREVLESSGFLVDAADSGIAAVVAAREGHPDLILVDLQLRDVPGGEAIGWLRSNPALRSTPIIVLTANAADDADLIAVRPASSLRKPLSPAAIRRAIRQLFK
jgi:CheY-like chemotaxis protein